MDTKVEIINREHWLTELVKRLEPMLAKQGKKMPKWRISMSFPVSSGRPRKGGRITLGECWAAETSRDQTREILVSPVRDEPVNIAETVLHEMCHAVLPSDVGHKAKFAHLAKACGLEGKPTTTEAGAPLREKLEEICAELGPYPHAALDATGRKKQSTRLLKSECPTCGYVVRVTWKWIDEAGHPICPSCYQPFTDPCGGENENPLEIAEQSVEYKVKGDKTERFRLRMIKKGRNARWVVLDHGDNLGYFAEGTPRLIPAESREDAVNVTEAIQAGLLTPEEIDARIDEEVDEEVDILSDEGEDEETPDFEDSILTPEEEIEYTINEERRTKAQA